ncbi:hypothetical protein N7490_012288 [Penicillium lividum]|nr:hypothetical protein N7490_012288 [Penicillium lividum]
MSLQSNSDSAFPLHDAWTHAQQGSPPASRTSAQNKPIRLALACKQCRKRKVRCDADQPKCRNCSLRGDLCETIDPRKSGELPAVRRRATKRWQSKAPQKVSKALAPAQPSPNTAALGAVRFINSVPNSTGPSPDSFVGQVSPGVRGISRSSAIPGSASSPASSSWRTNQSERLGEDHFSWQSRAYQESTAAHFQAATSGHDVTEQGSAKTSMTPYEGVATDSTDRVKHLGASSVHCLFNFVDLHMARYGFKQAASSFKHGMSHTEEFPMPLIPKLPLLPNRQRLSTYVDAFFSRLWPLYPIIDRASLEADINAIISLQADGSEVWQERVTLAHLPTLASIYAIISLGVNETAGDLILSSEYLTASHSLHGHLTAIPYMTSVQALLVLTLAMRAVAKDGQAWHLAGHAVRMAQSLGLHKPAATTSSTQGFTLGFEPETLHERLWWSCFSLEKLMQLECGRPSIIESSYDSLSVYYTIDQSSDQTLPYFRAWVALSSIMGRISNRLYSHRFQGGSAEMLGVVAKLDQELLEWGSSLPDPLKPWSTSAEYASDEQKVIAAFLSQQYYHAQLSVMRVAVIFPQKGLEREVMKNKNDLPNHVRLLDGTSICANAARSIVTQSLHLADSHLQSMLLAAAPSYLAAVVLALGVLQQPSSRLVRSDVELLASATEFVESWYLHRGFSAAFTQTCTHLRERVVSIFKRSDSSIQTPQTENAALYGAETIAGQHRRPGATNSINHSLPSGGKGARRGPQGFEASDATKLSADLFGNFEFDDLWNMTDLDFMIYDASPSDPIN